MIDNNILKINEYLFKILENEYEMNIRVEKELHEHNELMKTVLEKYIKMTAKMESLKKCIWTKETGYEELERLWETGCGKAHYFEVDGIKKNEYKYCPYCGNEIIEKSTPIR